MENILITGGAGFIGSNLTKELIKRGYNVTILDNLSEQIHGKNPEKDSFLYKSIADKTNFIKGSVTSKKDLLHAIKNQNIIVHLAAETGTGQSMYKISSYSKTNTCGTANLLDVLTNHKHSVTKLVTASSRAIYGEGTYLCETHGKVFPKQRELNDLQNGDFECKCPICNKNISPLPTEEDAKVFPTSIYGLTKFSQEQMSLITGQALGISTICFRYQNVYGPGQSLSNPYTGILSIFSSLIRNGQEINIFEDGKESRDFVYIDDVVKATILGIENTKIESGVYNVGTGIPKNVIKVVETLEKYCDLPVRKKISGNFRVGDIRHNYADITKINRELGFNPEISFEEGIKLFCNWVKKQPILIPKFNKSIQEMKNKGLLK